MEGGMDGVAVPRRQGVLQVSGLKMCRHHLSEKIVPETHEGSCGREKEEGDDGPYRATVATAKTGSIVTSAMCAP